MGFERSHRRSGLDDDLAFTHLALLAENRDHGLVAGAARHVGTLGEVLDGPLQVLGRLLPRGSPPGLGVLGPGKQLRHGWFVAEAERFGECRVRLGIKYIVAFREVKRKMVIKSDFQGCAEN